MYFRAAYGVTPKLTISIESGYFINKKMIELDNKTTIETSGIADLIIFPRYQALTIYALSEIPIYQYLNGSQVGSQFQFTTGISYKFNLKKIPKGECLSLNNSKNLKLWSLKK